MSYFPMMIDISGKSCLVVGGGSLAYRKVKDLLDFDAKVTVIAKEICQEIGQLENVVKIESAFDEDVLEQSVGQTKLALAVVATNDSQCNKEAANTIRKRGIPVNVVDQQEDCDFIFPAYIKEGDLVAAFSTSGSSPGVAQYMKTEAKKIVTKELAELASGMKEERPKVNEKLPSYQERKEYYQGKVAAYDQSKAKGLAVCAMFTTLIIIGAFIKVTIPFQAVPMHFTLQWLFVLMAALMLTPREAGISVGVYLIMGVIGIPVFASGGGFTYVLKPTFGYLLGFWFAAVIMSWLKSRLKRVSTASLLVITVIGALIYYGVGVLYFVIAGSFWVPVKLTWEVLLINCFLSTFVGDLVLCVLAVLIYKRLWTQFSRIR